MHLLGTLGKPMQALVANCLSGTTWWLIEVRLRFLLDSLRIIHKFTAGATAHISSSLASP